ncbi:hypothetical protein J4476_03400 [Candidatus Woesearchaeota archaeon]|nr:hypothetical protein [Candidatus Woesearchaeota archaeon]
MEEKVVLTLSEIEKRLTDISDYDKKKEFLKGIYTDKDYADNKRDIANLLSSLILNKDKKPKYHIAYDSLSEGIEPIYFWILDFMRDSGPSGLGMDVRKVSEDMEASVSSGYFGEIGQRTTLMQQKAMEYLGLINNIIKSLLNLIYDLKEFEIRLDPYNKLKDKSASPEDRDAAKRSLKGIWMDQVDARKGRGSINLLAQDLNFVTIRDAFFHVDKIESIDRLDLNERVKTLLKRKLFEYNKWEEVSEQEIRTRYNVERKYLKSQKGTLKLYASWAKPYLKAANKLKMKEFDKANIVNAFSNMEFEIKLHGKREIKPGSIHESFKEVDLERKYFSVVEVTMHFRSVPSVMSSQGGRHYIHGGRTDLSFRAYGLDDIELSAVESADFDEDLRMIEDYVGGSLDEISNEIAKYSSLDLSPKKEEKVVKKSSSSNMVNPFAGIFTSFNNLFSGPKDFFDFSSSHSKKLDFLYTELASKCQKDAEDKAYLVYNVYKKTHGMANI